MIIDNDKSSSIVFVGKQYFRDKTHGPAAVMFSLENALADLNITYESITLNEKCGKLMYFWKLLKLLSYKGKIINVHINGFVSAAIVCGIAKINKNCKYFLTAHGVYKEQIKYYDAGPLKGFYCFLEKYVYNSFPNIICVSELCKSKIQELYNPKGNIYVIENAVELKNNGLREKNTFGKEFLFLGGTKPVKGIDQLLDVFNGLTDMDKDVHLNIYGRNTPEELAEINDKISKMGKSESIRYLGYINTKEDLSAVFKRNDFHIALSKFDTFNVAIAEAMEYGCINITNMNSGAASLITHGENGFIVAREMDDYSISKLIYSIIHELSIEKYNKMRVDANEKIKGYTWKNVAMKYLELFLGKTRVEE